MIYEPTLNTVIFMIIFVAVYLTVLIRNAIKNLIDLYDLLLLSMVAVIPSILVFVPELFSYLAKLAGVEFPFVLLFGIVILIAYIFLYRILIIINSLRSRNITLIQELGLLDERYRQLQKEMNISSDYPEENHIPPKANR